MRYGLLLPPGRKPHLTFLSISCGCR